LLDLPAERRPLTYTPVYKTPPQRRKKERAGDEDASPEKRPIVLDLPPDSLLTDCLPMPTINYPQNHVSQQSTYNHPPTMADFKQMAMDAYNQRNNQNVSAIRPTGEQSINVPSINLRFLAADTRRAPINPLRVIGGFTADPAVGIFHSAV